MAVFDKCIDYVLVNEGRFVNNPLDHGGPTNFGITLKTLAEWRKTEVTVDDVKNLSVPEACKIYFTAYWAPLGLSSLDENSIATSILDLGVNFGIYGASLLVLKACGYNSGKPILPVDSDVINEIDPDVFIPRLVEEAKKKYEAIISHNPTQEKFRHGWMNRLDRMLNLVELNG